LEAISADLVKKDVFVVSHTGTLELPFGRKLSVYTAADYLKTQPEALRIYSKNRWDTGVKLATHIWMGDYQANARGEGISAYAKTGSSLRSEKDGEFLGIERLGVLRADVDNLGAVFSSGLPNDKISISRIAALSRQLSYFFKFQLNEILKAGDYQAQIIYSGGDDLFIIGNWSDVLYAAIDIRNALDSFTGNGSLTISAGIGMYDSHYPIARMAAETGELEAAAKSFRKRGNTDGMPDKDAVALWSCETVFSWDEFKGNIQDKLSEIQRVFDKNEKGKSFIYRLIALLRNTQDPVSVPRLAYLLARSFEGDKEHGAQTSRMFFEWATDTRERRFLAAALEWYVYSIRERPEERG
jgi:CRISPR-associated protein Csm1